MVDDGIIDRYAIGGAVAALVYIEPTMTEDLDILISAEGRIATSGLVTLEPLFAYLREAGYTEFRREGVVVEGWPVQFIPVSSDLDAEGLQEAAEIEIHGIKAKILRAEHLDSAKRRSRKGPDSHLAIHR